MKNNTHCGSEFPGMNEFSGVKINADEVRAVVKKFERQLKSGRVFFPGDAPFAMKCETLLKNAAPDIEGLSVSGRSFTATDKTLYAESDTPKTVAVDESDIIAVLDDTKKGLFGNLAKKECVFGTLVTTKGILNYHKTDGKTRGSGFVTWPSIAVSPTDPYPSVLFRNRCGYEFPQGSMVLLNFHHVCNEEHIDNLHELVLHLAHIAKGKGAEFDYDEFRPEGAEEADE